MKKWFPHVLALLVSIEVMCVVYIGIRYISLTQIKERVLGISTETQLDTSDLIFSSDSEFDHFYEPKPNEVEMSEIPWSKERVSYTINSDSLNERYDYEVPKPDGVYRIVTLGDSFTFGQYVHTADNWTEKLEDMLNSDICSAVQRVEVVNLGMMGYDILFESYRYRVRGVKYEPDFVIWFLNQHNFFYMPQLMHDDIEQLNQEISDEELQRAQDRGNYYKTWVSAANNVIDRFGMKRIVAQENEALYDMASVYDGPLLFVMNAVDAPYVKLIEQFQAARGNGYTYIDSETLDVFAHPDWLFPDRHPNRYGHENIASYMFSRLVTFDDRICTKN